MVNTIQVRLCSIVVILSLFFLLPGIAGAAAEPDPAPQESQETQEIDNDKKTVAGQPPDVSSTEIEVRASKETGPTIGQGPDAEGVKDYVITRTTTGSKTDQPTKDVPQSIAVVGQKVLKEQNTKTLESALANIAGVNTGTGIWNPNANLNPSFFIRGFSSNNYYIDGLYDTANAGAAAFWTGNIDRIEVLKGPSSLFFGQLQPGGVINLVTKKPLTEKSFTMGQEFSSWGTRSTSLDVSIPLTQDKKWLSRTIIETDHLTTFQKDVYNNHFNASIIVQGKPREDTTYTFQATNSNYNILGGYPGGRTYIGSITAPYGLIPYDANYYDPSQRYYFISRSLSARVDHKFNDTWTVTSALRYDYAHHDRSYLGDERWVNNAYTTGKIQQYYSHDIFDIATYAWDTTANARFRAWGFDHNLVLGYEWSRYSRLWPLSASGNATAVNYLNPVFTLPAVISSGSRSPLALYRFGAYLNDTVTVTDKLKVSGGISRSTYTEGVGGSGTNTSGNTWRLGITYETSPGLTWFVGYGTSFNYNSPQTIKVANVATGTQFFAPRTGYQYEGGLKYEISNKANITLARYVIHETNVVTNVGTSTDTDYQLINEQVSKGIELDANYVLRPGWNLLVAYSRGDSRTVQNYTSPALIGKQTVAVPNQMFKLWSTYEFQEGRWKGWGYGGGLTYVSKRPFDSANTIWVPGYTVFDAVVYYKAKDWSYTLNLYNLTNKQYWVEQNGVEVFPGTPRSFSLRVEKKF
ncbi:MAG TPA: TonB-dependent siderophore receptor [Patescibacteria group bacterium]|nr:TonB-dependent siderophore receptor [Patescibacteria group bacterium]